MNASGDEGKQRVKVLLFGNAILDIGKRVSDDTLHKKFNLKLDDQLEAEPELLQALKNDLDKVEGDTHITSGGSCLNSCKILNQLGEHNTIFCGGIGTDENAETLQHLLDQNHIRRRLQQMPNYSTALCICLIHNESRCLLANIGASTHFNSVELVQELANTVSPCMCYIEGYFVPRKISICKLIFQRFCVEQSARLVLNLNATYIVDQYPEDVLWLLKRSHFIFGNRREFDTLLQVAGAEDIPQLLRGLASNPMDGRTCVITDGANRVQYVRYASNNKNGVQVGWVEVPKVGDNSVVDTTGAGDAFVAGFLHRYLKACGGGGSEGGGRGETEISLEDCIRNGVEVAQRKLAYHGCTLLGEQQ